MPPFLNLFRTSSADSTTPMEGGKSQPGKSGPGQTSAISATSPNAGKSPIYQKRGTAFFNSLMRRSEKKQAKAIALAAKNPENLKTSDLLINQFNESAQRCATKFLRDSDPVLDIVERWAHGINAEGKPDQGSSLQWGLQPYYSSVPRKKHINGLDRDGLRSGVTALLENLTLNPHAGNESLRTQAQALKDMTVLMVELDGKPCPFPLSEIATPDSERMKALDKLPPGSPERIDAARRIHAAIVKLQSMAIELNEFMAGPSERANIKPRADPDVLFAMPQEEAQSEAVVNPPSPRIRRKPVAGKEAEVTPPATPTIEVEMAMKPGAQSLFASPEMKLKGDAPSLFSPSLRLPVLDLDADLEPIPLPNPSPPPLKSRPAEEPERQAKKGEVRLSAASELIAGSGGRVRPRLNSRSTFMTSRSSGTASRSTPPTSPGESNQSGGLKRRSAHKSASFSASQTATPAADSSDADAGVA